jgi:hypothetical protein
MVIAGYVFVCVQRYCVGFHCLSLHVSAYMAIFRCVGYFIFICLKDSASLLSSTFFSRGHSLHVFICVFLFSFVIFVVSLRVCLCVLLASPMYHPDSASYTHYIVSQQAPPPPAESYPMGERAAVRQTHTQGNNKNNEGKQSKNTNRNMQSVTT